MSLQDVLNSRRTFLQRSALGFGSVLFAPVLLESCTDHLITPPVTPVKPPLLGDGNSTDWNDDAKVAVKFGLADIPIVGAFFNALVDIFWPSSGVDVWSLIKDQVKELIDQEIDDADYNDVLGKLGSLDPQPRGAGLMSFIITYQYQLKNGQPSDILGAWNTATGQFAGALGSFKNATSPVAVLPLFAQYANLYLALLRDGVKYGQSWGRTDDQHNTIDVPALTNTITDFYKYAADTYNGGRSKIVGNTLLDNIKVEPFRSINAYDRSMTMLVLDYMDTWPYYDITTYPQGAQNPDGTPVNLFTREIYSDPYGNLHGAGSLSIVLPTQQPTQFPTQITAWGGQRLDAVQLTYPAGSGPNGVTTTPRMGDVNGGSTRIVDGGGTVDVPTGYHITRPWVTYSDVGSMGAQAINTLLFELSDGNNSSLSLQLGGNLGEYQSGFVGYDKYALSSIYIHGASDFLPVSSADCIVFGFMPLLGR